jgi:N-sulfoglucosamine sulfohydrolase
MKKNKSRALAMAGITGLALLPSACTPSGEDQNAGRPNIVWIVCEDMNPILGCYGDKLAKTPNIDKLAETGIVFRQAYASAPICAPARSCLITGVYPTSLGTPHLRQEQTIPQWMKTFPQYLTESGYFTTNQNKTDFNFSPQGVFDYHKDDLYPWRQRQSGQPFFSFFNIGDTHEGPGNSSERHKNLTANLSAESLTSSGEITLPPYYPETPEMREIWARYYDLAAAMDAKVGQIIKNLEEDGLMENTIIFFFSDHGHGLPRYKRWLNITGLRVPFVAWLPEKYQHLAKNTQGTDNHDLVSFVDFAPTVLNLAGVAIPEYMNGIPLLGENLPEPHAYLFASRDRADDMYEVSRAIHDKEFIYIRHYLPHLPYFQPGIINSEEKESHLALQNARRQGVMPPAGEVMFHPKPVEELYDLRNDPDELNNLANNPGYSGKLAEMRNKLKREILSTRDACFLFEPEMMMRSEGTTSYEMAQDTSGYDLGKIFETAEMVGKAPVSEIAARLSDPDSGVRFWAVTGLLNNLEGSKPHLTEISQLLNDSSPTVQIAAAELLCKLGSPKEALPVLEKWITDDRMWLALYAARTVQMIGKEAQPMKQSIQAAIEKLAVDLGNRNPHPGSNYVYRDGNFASFTGWALEGAMKNLK